MSGLEVVGVVASIVQLADFGARVAVQLHSFYHRVKKADINIQRLSTDVSLTSSVLKQLGDILRDAEQQKICSTEAVSMANQIVRECEQIFQQMESTLKKGVDLKKGKILKVGLSQKVDYAFSESEVSILQTQLDRLKATMLLLLHVMSYASQARQRESQTVRQEQKDFIKILLQEIDIIEQHLKQSTTLTQCCVRNISDQQSSDTPATRSIGSDSYLGQLTEKASCLPNNEKISRPIGRYFLLVQSLLKRVDESKLGLDGGQRRRVRQGILSVQSQEQERIRSKHGDFGDRICKLLFPLPEKIEPIRRPPPLASTADIDAARRDGFSNLKARPKDASAPKDRMEQQILTDIARATGPADISFAAKIGLLHSFKHKVVSQSWVDSIWREQMKPKRILLPSPPRKRNSTRVEDIVLEWTNLTSNELADDEHPGVDPIT
ncbi:unnamed protein product [Penicillium salamii]|uniref:Fungal N-terminal domain-containing protein n=1 Tax=Penicillium salamii TaxID=1612424 RepID=A0A9W4NL34_9EURO|nr:unnamed protein product [Penicillium salamii]